MPDRKTAPLASRKQPRQTRSADLVSAILEAALRLLAEEGAGRFTTTRVAERAGVSVGSLYQYFPNKAAILFRLQSDEWRQTNRMLSDILADRARPPLLRVRLLVHAFVRSECEEAAVRGALDDAAPLYRHAPEARAVHDDGQAALALFLDEALPNMAETDRIRTGDLLKTTLGAGGKAFSEVPRSEAEIVAYADALADMLCFYLERLAQTPPSARKTAI
jgi:AcrR family transcriptional regulator